RRIRLPSSVTMSIHQMEPRLRSDIQKPPFPASLAALAEGKHRENANTRQGLLPGTPRRGRPWRREPCPGAQAGAASRGARAEIWRPRAARMSSTVPALILDGWLFRDSRAEGFEIGVASAAGLAQL